MTEREIPKQREGETEREKARNNQGKRQMKTKRKK